MVSRALQGEVWVCGADQGRVRTAFGRRCAHAEGAGAYRALLKELVDWRGRCGTGPSGRCGDGGGQVGGEAAAMAKVTTNPAVRCSHTSSTTTRAAGMSSAPLSSVVNVDWGKLPEVKFAKSISPTAADSGKAIAAAVLLLALLAAVTRRHTPGQLMKHIQHRVAHRRAAGSIMLGSAKFCILAILPADRICRAVAAATTSSCRVRSPGQNGPLPLCQPRPSDDAAWASATAPLRAGRSLRLYPE